jgi:hypothetical protein
MLIPLPPPAIKVIVGILVYPLAKGFVEGFAEGAGRDTYEALFGD